MRIARELIIGKLLQHKEAFYPLLDYIADHRGAYEVPQSLYLREYRRRILPAGDDQAMRMLTLESLHENGIFFHLDNQMGSATLHAWLVDMLRFTDTSRMRELSNADFENLRAQFQRALDKFEALPITPGASDYEDEKVTLFELIDTTLSRIQTNVEALAANASRLGRDFDQLDAEGHSSSDSRRLLESAAQLYERFIKPCLEFLSPSLGLRNEKKTFTESMEGLAGLHERAGADDIAYRLLFKMTAIRSYFKDIAEIEKQVQRYHRSLEEERRRYRAIEAGYNELVDAVLALRHGKLRHTQLPASHPVFSRDPTFQGLHTHGGKYAQKLNWYDSPNRIWLEEWVEAIGRGAAHAEVAGVQPLPAKLDVARERREQITRLCMTRAIDLPCTDIVRDFHCWLPTMVDDYALPDLVVAYQAFMGLSEMTARLTWSRSRAQVDDGHYSFDYLVASLGAAATEVPAP